MSQYDFEGEIRRMVGAAIGSRNDHIERWVERMLVTPDAPGIALIEGETRIDLTEENGYSLIAEDKIGLHPGVPFGHIYRFRNEGSFLAWVANGCPVQE